MTQNSGTKHFLSLGQVIGVAICYAVGTGMLSLPLAFYKAGLLVSALLLIVMTSFSAFSTKMMTESTAAACALERRRRGGDQSAPDFDLDAMDGVSIPYTEVVRSHVGQTGAVVLSLSVFLYLSTTLVFYASTAISSLTSSIPIVGLTTGTFCPDAGAADYPGACNSAYWVWLGVFMLICLVLGLGNVADTAIIQNIFTIYRWFVVAFILATCTWSLFAGPALDGPAQPTHAPYIAQPAHLLVGDNWQSAAYLVPSAAFATIYHHSHSLLLQPLRDKARTASRFAYTLNAALFAIYFIVGAIGALTFGPENKTLIIFSFLQWGGANHWKDTAQPLWAAILAKIVTLYPAISLASSYPLNALTLSEELYIYVRHAIRAVRRHRGPALLAETNDSPLHSSHSANDVTAAPAAPAPAPAGGARGLFNRLFPPDPEGVPQWVHALTRVSVVAVPIVVAGFVRSASLFIKISGLLGFVFLLFMPPITNFLCRRHLDAEFGKDTHRQNPFFSRVGGYAVGGTSIGLGVVAAALAVASIVRPM